MKRKTLTRVQLAKHWRDVGYFVGKGEGYAAAIEDAAKVVERYRQIKDIEALADEIRALLSRGSR